MRMVKDGSNGRGKQRTQTSGHIKLDWQMVGFHKILLITNSRIFVEVLQNVRTRNFPSLSPFSPISCTTLHEHSASLLQNNVTGRTRICIFITYILICTLETFWHMCSYWLQQITVRLIIYLTQMTYDI